MTGLRHLAKNPEGNKMYSLKNDKKHTKGQIFQLFLTINQISDKRFGVYIFIKHVPPSTACDQIRDNEKKEKWVQTRPEGALRPSQINPHKVVPGLTVGEV